MAHDLFLYTCGEKSNPPVVFLHGGGLGARMWLPAMDKMQGYYCIAPDLPDHGNSRHHSFTLNDAALRIANLIDEVAPHGKAHLVGLSLGGVVALEVMRVAPQVLDHVIISGASMKLSDWLVNAQSLNEPVLRMLKPNQLTYLMKIQFGIPDKYLPLIEPDVSVFTPEAFRRMNEAYRHIALPEACSIPTLVTVGEKETPVAKEMAKRIHAGLPASQLRVIGGVGHAWNLQAPELFARVASAWLRGESLPDEIVSLG